jgi:serine/threonine protein kinase
METLHNRGFIHWDIKSDNFLIGCYENINKVYVIDLGLSKRYIHPHTYEHILMKKHKGLIGTARFASINAHLGLE